METEPNWDVSEIEKVIAETQGEIHNNLTESAFRFIGSEKNVATVGDLIEELKWLDKDMPLYFLIKEDPKYRDCWLTFNKNKACLVLTKATGEHND